MALSLGSSAASKIYLGATEIALAYLGTTQVYSAGGAFSAEAQNYFDRLDTAGDTTYTAYKQPLANYIDSLVALGGAYWDTMLSATSFVGVGIQGITVPLRDGMTVPTNNNFVVGDLDQLTGLKGDGSTKYLNTSVNAAFDLALNDVSYSAFSTDRGTLNGRSYIYAIDRNLLQLGFSDTSLQFRCQDISKTQVISLGATSGFIGASRSSSTGYDAYAYDKLVSIANTSSNADNANYGVFGTSTGTALTDGRIATYHIGPALDLATLEGLQDTLITEVAEAQFSAEAANYFSRLVAAGDTTHYAYRQPLANYIDSLVTLGGAYWDTMLSSASFVGVGFQGITVPLRDGMPVLSENNFIAADLDQLTGLKGDSSTKSINLNINVSSFSRDDHSVSIYRAESAVTQARELSISPNGIELLARTSSIRAISTNGAFIDGSGTAPTFVGFSRSNSAGYDWRCGTSGTRVNASLALAASASSASLFALAGGASAFSDVRMATYHVGPALDLATLEGLQDTLITEIAAI